MVFTFFFYTLISNPNITSTVFLSSITLCLFYGVANKEVNLIHISLFSSTLYIAEYITIDFYYDFLLSNLSSKVLIGTFYYGYQIKFSIIAFFIFILRVQISRTISNSKKIKLTPFDNIMPWIYIYNTIIATLHTIDFYINEIYEIKTLSFFYSFYEELIYLGMTMVVTLLFSMIIYHKKELEAPNYH